MEGFWVIEMRRACALAYPLPSQAETCFPLLLIHLASDAIYQKCSHTNLVRNRHVGDVE